MKLKRYWFLLILVASACAPFQKDDNVEKAKSLFEAFNKHDWKTMAGLYKDPAMFLDPAFGSAYVPKTRAETIEKYSGMQAMFPDIRDDITGIYASENTVTIEFVSTGTSADGQRFSLPIVTILTFENGEIVKDATYYDNP